MMMMNIDDVITIMVEIDDDDDEVLRKLIKSHRFQELLLLVFAEFFHLLQFRVWFLLEEINLEGRNISLMPVVFKNQSSDWGEMDFNQLYFWIYFNLNFFRISLLYKKNYFHK